ncbi:hypothetical protein I3843_16G032400 [Carya illinoinensis]|uniref:PPM-type phosphatase domain-containing protein n=1 Tax=Carya illinoinensis TaxID=32201 RepID=A0A8T1N636_CARIL|nr:probable protein phosphatase 2C 72 [Carya illinoinensis]KAG6624487.1 hypothetical protein CIPAW_16G030100 [Carya illinoinensis]KAG7941290.1 hypothetical protein I3843_16G032400 [Carya illinoinensis]
MGICSSVASLSIHDAEDGHENAIFIQGNNISNGLGSLYSKQGSKGLNQDAAILYQGYGVGDGALCGVFDGHGKNGQVVSEIVCNQLPSLLLSQKNALSKVNFYMWKEACISAFKLMDKVIELQEILDCSCSGTTAVVAIRQGQDLVIANLGDSRAVLGTLAKNGVEAVQLTRDLKPGLPSEAERIRNCNGRVAALNHEPHIQRVWLPHDDTPGLAMSRPFGDFILKDHGIIAIPEIKYHRLTSNDQFIILATDGVWDVLSNDQVASIVWEAESEQVAARVVVEAAITAWKKKSPTAKVDDCSVVCLFLQKKHHVVAVDT